MTTSDRQSCLDVMKDAIRAHRTLPPQCCWKPAMDSRSRHWPPKVASEVKGPEDQEVPHE